MSNGPSLRGGLTPSPPVTTIPTSGSQSTAFPTSFPASAGDLPHDPAFAFPDPHSVPGTQYNSYNGAMIVGAGNIGLAFEFHAWNDDLNTVVLFDPYSVGVPCDGGLAPPPVSPSSLSAAETGATSIEVTWTDNAINEAGFDVEVSTTGINGPWAVADSVWPGVETYLHTGHSPATEY